jgi:hypothetical protein
MQPRHFNMLALSAVISLIAAGVVHSSYNSWNEDTVTGNKLFPSLASDADRTNEIAIQTGNDKLTLQKSTDGKSWTLVERAGYPVDAAKIRKLVVSLSQAELIERKTRNKELYGQLDLGDPSAKEASSKLVRLSDKSGKVVADVVIGKERRGAFGSGKAGTYVRSLSDPQTWLAKLELNASTDVVDWVKTAFFVVDENQIESVAVKDGDKVVYAIGRGPAEGAAGGDADGKKDAEKKADAGKEPVKKGPFKLVDVPKGKKLNAKVKVDELINGIRTLELLDVRKATDADAKPDMTAEITLGNGAKYSIGMKREDSKRWMTVAVLANGKGEDEATAKAQADATKGWAFEIADWRANQTFKNDKELFEVVEAETPKVSLPPAAKNAGQGAPKPEPETTEAKQPEPADADVMKK